MTTPTVQRPVLCIHGLRLLPEPSACAECRYGEPTPCRDPACPCWRRDDAAGAHAAFDAHLDRCAQCAEHPFDLCPTGDFMLRKAAEAIEKGLLR